MHPPNRGGARAPGPEDSRDAHDQSHRRIHKGSQTSGPIMVPVMKRLIPVLLATASLALAHTVTGRDADFVRNSTGTHIAPFLYLGAKHMLTGYDHLIFLLGVIFFLYKLKDVAVYVTCFAVGHSITLLAGVLGGVHVNPYIVDAL